MTQSMKRTIFALPVFILAACTASQGRQLNDATTTPLRDVNIAHAAIPTVLVAAQREPYLFAEQRSCGAISDEVRALDETLGPDFDAPPIGPDPGLIERGIIKGTDTTIGTVKGAAEGVVPFRQWVRKLSGAKRCSKEVSAAITAGTSRRAFLKGVRVTKGCAWA
jgi:hypothetical protein